MKRYNFFNRAINYIFLLMGLYGMAQLFLSAFELRLFNGMYSIVLAVFCLIAYLIHIYFSEKTYQLFTIIAVIIWFMIGWMLRSFLQFSFYGLVNHMDFGIQYDNSLEPNLLIIYILAILNIAYIYLYFRGKKIAYIILPAPLIIVLLLNRMPSSVSIIFVFISIVCSSLYKNIEQINKHLVYPTGVAVTAVLLLLLAEFIVPQKEYDNSGGFIIKLINHFERQKELEEEPLIAPGGISGGTLGMYDAIEFQQVKMMTLITGYTGDIHLRSFVGAVYHQNRWDKLPDEVYADNKRIFDGSIYHIDIYNQQANLYTVIEQDKDLVSYLYGDFKNYFNKVGNRKYYVGLETRTDKNYWYMPYGNGYFVSNKNAPDSYPLDCSEGKIAGRQYYEKDIDYDAIISYLEAYNGTNIKMNQYIEWEKQYRAFVYRQYTNQTVDYSAYIDAARVPIPQFYGNIHSAADKLAFANYLKAYFEENFNYSLKTGALKEDEDFVKKFLSYDKEGYCTHFASAATIIMRNAGIPARYVEGYHVLSNDSVAEDIRENIDIIENFDFKVENKYMLYTIPVLDSNAHAWTEIYMDGYGWIPLEFTPSYTSNVVMQEGAVEIKKQDEALNPIVEENTKSDLNDTYEKPSKYDTIEEYMNHNDTNRIDFSIVLPIIGRQLLRFLFYLLVGVLFLCGVAVCFFIPAKYLEIKRRSLFQINESNTPKEDERQVIKAYQYVEKICRFLKIHRTNDMTCTALAQECIKYDDFFKEAHIEYVMYAIEKVSFGHETIGKVEVKNAVDAVRKIHDACYRKQGTIGKILFRYIWHLY